MFSCQKSYTSSRMKLSRVVGVEVDLPLVEALVVLEVLVDMVMWMMWMMLMFVEKVVRCG
jgi:hypothetical protein